MDKQFQKRLERVKNPRIRKHNVKQTKKFVRPSSNLAVAIDELKHPIVVEGCRAEPGSYMLKPSVKELLGGAGAAVGLTFAASMDGIEAVKKCLGKKERMLKLEKRRMYYAAEAEKRAAQREELRQAAVKPANPCPSPTAITDAYLHRRDSDECILRFGKLMIDLEEHARRVWQITGNKITGSSGGVKDWLKENCPLLAEHYSTCQRYKRLAQQDSDT